MARPLVKLGRTDFPAHTKEKVRNPFNSIRALSTVKMARLVQTCVASPRRKDLRLGPISLLASGAAACRPRPGTMNRARTNALSRHLLIWRYNEAACRRIVSRGAAAFPWLRMVIKWDAHLFHTESYCSAFCVCPCAVGHRRKRCASHLILGLNSALPVAESFMQYFPDPVQLTRELLKFNTINPPGAEQACAQYLGDLLKRAGFGVSWVPGSN